MHAIVKLYIQKCWVKANISNYTLKYYISLNQHLIRPAKLNVTVVIWGAHVICHSLKHECIQTASV